LDLTNQALGWIDRQIAIGGEVHSQQLLPILDAALAHDAVAIGQAEDPIAGGEALLNRAIRVVVRLGSAEAFARGLLGLTLLALAAQPLDQRIRIGRAFLFDAWPGQARWLAWATLLALRRRSTLIALGRSWIGRGAVRTRRRRVDTAAAAGMSWRRVWRSRGRGGGGPLARAGWVRIARP